MSTTYTSSSSSTSGYAEAKQQTLHVYDESQPQLREDHARVISLLAITLSTISASAFNSCLWLGRSRMKVESEQTAPRLRVG